MRSLWNWRGAPRGMQGALALMVTLLAAAASPAADEMDAMLEIEGRELGQALSRLEIADVDARPSLERDARNATLSSESAGRAKSLNAEVELVRLREENRLLRERLAAMEARHALELYTSYYNMGCVYKAAKEYARAEAEFLKALGVNPDDAGIHYNLGILYDDDLDEPAKARQHYAAFLKLAPDDPDAALVREWLVTLD